MVIIYAAGTAPINPAAAPGPTLSIAQVWKGLELKLRKPQLFLSVIDRCTVIQDTGDTVLREVHLKNVPGAAAQSFSEYITHFAPLLKPGAPAAGAETFAAVGTAGRHQNIVSQGPDGELFLTFTYEWEHPDVAEGSDEHLQKAKQYQAMVPGLIEGTLGAMREMVGTGEL